MDGATIKCPQCQTENTVVNNYCSGCGALLKTSLVDQSQLCPFCRTPIKAEDYFCPNCSRRIREKPLSTSFLTQLGIYALSVFLPPLGLWPGFKYLRRSEPKMKKIGGIAVVLTIISIIVSVYFTVVIINQVNEQVNQQMKDLNF